MRSIRKIPCRRAEITAVDRREAMFETMMLGLRMTDGVSERDFERMHGAALFAGLRPGAGEARGGRGWGRGPRRAGGEAVLPHSPRGLEVQNEALMALMP